jgi:hypothetical protein
MAINLWTAAGQPTEFLPATDAVSVSVPIGIGEYVLKFKAKSTSGNSTFMVTDSAGKAIQTTLKPTTEYEEYTFDIKRLVKGGSDMIYPLYNVKGADIFMKDIEFYEKPYGKATINGIEGFGTVKPGFNGKLFSTMDFKGKTKGSVLENPHIGKVIDQKTTLQPPTAAWIEFSQFYYNKLASLDGQTAQYSTANTSGAMSQHLFAFDVVAEFERNLGAIPSTDKVQWMKDNMSAIYFNWDGFGTSVGGNKATLKAWNSGGWVYPYSHTNGTVSRLTWGLTNTSLPGYISSSGVIHFIVHAEPSDGVTPSMINTDFVNFKMEMKQASIVDSKWTLHPNAKVIDNETLELDGTSRYLQSKIWIPVTGGQTYTYSIGEDVGTSARLAGGWEDGVSSATISYTPEVKAGVLSQTIVAPSNAKLLRISVDNTSDTPGTFIFKRPMLNLGNTPAPYEPKRGDRLAMPVPVKNLFDYKRFVTTQPVTQIPTGYRANGYANSGTHPLNLILKPSTTYVFSGKVKVINGEGLGAFGRITMTDGTNWCHMNSGGVSGSIVQVFTTPADLSKYTSFYVYGSSTGAGTVEITDIQIEEGYLPTPYDPYKVKGNGKLFKRGKTYIFNDGYVGKTSGVVETNAHKAFRGARKQLDPVAAYTTEFYTSEYEMVSTLNGLGFQYTSSVVGVLAHQVFCFDLIWTVEKKWGYEIPASTVAGKVQWLRANLNKLRMVWSGYGQSPTGYKASIGMYHLTYGWTGWKNTHTASTVTQLSIENGSYPYPASSHIDDNGKVWFVAMAEPTDGAVGSKITTDEVRLVVETKEITHDLIPLPSPKVRIPKKNIVPNVPSLWEQGHIDSGGTNFNSTTNVRSIDKFPIRGGVTHVLSADPLKRVIVYYYDNFGKFITTPNAYWLNGEVFTPPINCGFLRISVRNNDLSPLLPEHLGNGTKIQIEEGSKITPYEPHQLVNGPSHRGLAFSGISSSEYVGMLPAIPQTFDVTVKFKATSLTGGSFKMLWGSQDNLIYLGISTTSSTLFVSSQRADTGVQVTYPSGAAKVELNRVHEARLVVDGKLLKIYLDGALTSTYDMGFNPRPVGSSLLGKYTGGLPFTGVIYNAKVEGIYDVDFTDPNTITGTYVKSAGTTIGNLYGTPYPRQLNKLAKR